MMECDRGRLQESLLVSGPGLRSGWPALAAKKHSNKRIIYWRRKEGEAERVVQGGHCTEAFQNCVSETLAPSQHSQPVCNIPPPAPPLTFSAATAHMLPPQSSASIYIYSEADDDAPLVPPAPIVCQSGHSPLKPNRTVYRPGVGKLRPYTGAICGRLRFLFIPSSLKK